jgi:hypothetical protein
MHVFGTLSRTPYKLPDLKSTSFTRRGYNRFVTLCGSKVTFYMAGSIFSSYIIPEHVVARYSGLFMLLIL